MTTVEALGGHSRPLHKVQSTIADKHGSQCGFCTPGFVMAIYAYLSEHPNATGEELEMAVDGNLCRCTGYRPLMDAMHTLGACDGKGGCGCGGAAGHKEAVTAAVDVESSAALMLGTLTSARDLEAPRPPLAFERDGVAWYAPRTVTDFAALKAAFPDARVIVGNSEVGVEMRGKMIRPPHMIYVGGIPELNELRLTETGMTIGAAVPLTDIEEYIEKVQQTEAPERCRAFAAILKQLKFFACRQVRNVACIGGNLTTASPTSDLSPVFLATNTKINVLSAAHGARVADIASWFVGYRRVALAADEVVTSVEVPFTRPDEYVKVYKVSRRKEDDIHISGACFRVVLRKTEDPIPKHEAASAAAAAEKRWRNPLLGDKLAPAGEAEAALKDQYEAPAFKFLPACEEEGGMKLLAVEDMSLAFGSMAVRTSLAPSAAEYARGKAWTSDILDGVFAGVEKDLPLAANTPGGMVDYRRCMTRSLFYKFFMQVCSEAYGAASIPAEYRSALEDFERKTSTSQQSYDQTPLTDEHAVNASVKHMSADKQTTGEALFLDDMPNATNGLYAALFTSAKAYAKIKSVDVSQARAYPGVVDIVMASDIPGENFVGEAKPGEELFSTEYAQCVGYPIGAVVAESQQIALEAVRLVKVEYEELEPILNIEDAIRKDSYLSPWFEIPRGDVEKGLAEADYVVDGEVVVEGQDQFYLEPQCSLAIPGECGEMEIIASTQNPRLTQSSVAKVLGLPENMVKAHVRRTGGGFGGKESRSAPFSCIAAVAANKLKRPVRIVLDRATDMQIHGTRHPFLARYKVGYNKDGKIVAYDVVLYSNGGHSLDLSIAILHRALFHVDNAYWIPNVRCRGRVCRTNRPSNTAFRGFGGNQGMSIIENIAERIAVNLGRDPEEIRRINFYVEGQRTHYNKAVECNQLQNVWAELVATSEYQRRRAAVTEFNAHNHFHKRGLAIVPVKFGISFTHAPLNQAGALVHVYADGTVLVAQGACEIGQGVFTKMAQIAATALRIPLSLVRVGDTSTETVANTSATAASVQADLNGMAVLNACTQIRTRLDEFAKATLPEGIKTPWKELVHEAYEHRIDLSAHGFYEAEFGFNFKTLQGRVFAYYTYGAACSEVDVDVLTGEHTILRSDIVMDVGTSLNPALDVGQVEGAFLQGVGWCTTEQIVPFRGSGALYTRGPGTYKVPGPGDVPTDFRVSLLKNSKNPFAVFSSKGLGEPPLYLGISVMFAIKDAVRSARKDAGIDGYFQMTLPATCERIRLACRDALTETKGPRNEPGCFIEEYPNTPDILAPEN